MAKMKARICQFMLHEIPNSTLDFSSAEICILYRVVRTLADSWLSHPEWLLPHGMLEKGGRRAPESSGEPRSMRWPD